MMETVTANNELLIIFSHIYIRKNTIHKINRTYKITTEKKQIANYERKKNISKSFDFL